MVLPAPKRVLLTCVRDLSDLVAFEAVPLGKVSAEIVPGTFVADTHHR
jgi:hypothetical protein